MSINEIAIVFIDQSVSSAAFSAFKMRNLLDKPQATKDLGRIFFYVCETHGCILHKEKQKVDETETISENSVQNVKIHILVTGNYCFFFPFLFCCVVFWIPPTRHNIHIQQKWNNRDKTVSLTFFCRPRSKINIQSPC